MNIGGEEMPHLFDGAVRPELTPGGVPKYFHNHTPPILDH